MLERLKVVLFLIVFHKMFVWNHEPPIGDFEGYGPSPDVLKHKPKIASELQKYWGFY